jgi:hypothetical protein
MGREQALNDDNSLARKGDGIEQGGWSTSRLSSPGRLEFTEPGIGDRSGGDHPMIEVDLIRIEVRNRGIDLHSRYQLP